MSIPDITQRYPDGYDGYCDYEKEQIIEYIRENTPAYQGMEDDLEGLEDLEINELKKIMSEI